MGAPGVPRGASRGAPCAPYESQAARMVVLRCVFDDCNLQLDVLRCVFDDDLAQPLCFAMVIFRKCNTSHAKRTNMNRPRLAVDNLQKKITKHMCFIIKSGV